MARPRRGDYERATDWLVAALVWLEHKWPDESGQDKRIAKWQELDAEAGHGYNRARLLELIEREHLSTAELAEFDLLIDQYKRREKATRNERKAR